MSKFIPVLAIIINIGIAAVSMWTAINIKFAPDKATVVRSIKSIFLRVVRWMAHAGCAGAIIWFFIFWPAVDRLFMFVVISNSFALSFSFVVSRETKIVNAIVALRDTDKALLDLIGDLKKADALIFEHSGLVAKLKSP